MVHNSLRDWGCIKGRFYGSQGHPVPQLTDHDLIINDMRFRNDPVSYRDRMTLSETFDTTPDYGKAKPSFSTKDFINALGVNL